MRYPGGKGRCYQHIVSLMPPHRTYIETHLGGGAVLRHKKLAERSIGIDLDDRVIARWRGVDLPGLSLVHGDALAFLRSFSFDGSELVYCDPPYLRSTRRSERIYRHECSEAQHKDLLALLRTLPCAVILSSYECPLYAETLSDWRSVQFPGDSHVGPRTEWAWCNFPEPVTLHDPRFVGADFREREKIKRRRVGLTRKIERLPALERAALLNDLRQRYPALEGSP
jgi:DNA adenine methylase